MSSQKNSANLHCNKAVEIQSVVFGYNQSPALINIDHWLLEKHFHTFLYGASGSGKSTLLNLLCGILTPQQGSIHLLGKEFSQLRTRQRDKFRAQHIGVVFQEFNLIPFLTVWENIQLASHFSGSKKNDFREHAAQLFDRLKLNDQLLSKRADTLSVGQRQRVAIVRALINQPELLIADEPTSSLDSGNRDEFMQLLLENGEQSSCTVLFVSHDKSLQSHFSNHLAIDQLFEVNHAV